MNVFTNKKTLTKIKNVKNVKKRFYIYGLIHPCDGQTDGRWHKRAERTLLYALTR